MDKEVYIVSNYDTKFSRAVRLTEDQARAINWFISEIIETGCDYGCELAEDCACDDV